jgi:hypothetical protein
MVGIITSPLQPDPPPRGLNGMKRLTTGLVACLLFAPLPAWAQFESYRFAPDRVPVGQVFHYLKSQRDGSHATRVSVYLPSVDRVESLKWDQGGDQATLVVATLDWERFSVSGFEAWGLARGSEPELRATLRAQADQLHISFVDQPVRISHWPWHSYDFDFTSLTLTLPHRLDPTRDLDFWRTDFVYGDPPAFAELGPLTLRYQGKQRRHGKPAWRYSLGGPGLEGKAGSWWVDRNSGLTLEYELPVGDEPGYADVRFRLESSAAMTPAQWRAFKLASVGS